jgi:outer membrane receptor protein involved in Fe transport
MMNLNRAAVLQQIPANSIDKIEVITNPSAKYKPDGTSGIINIVLKKNKSLGMNGNFSANVGNQDRYNANLTINYNPGKWNFFGNAGIRQDERQRINDIATQTFVNGIETSSIINHSESSGRPLSKILGLGTDYKLNQKNKFGLSGNYNTRYQEQNDHSVYKIDSLSYRKQDYDRDRYQPQTETDIQLTAYYQHHFGKEGHDLNLNYTNSHSRELEDNYYTNTYRLPESQINYDNVFYDRSSIESQFLAEYANPLSEGAKLEAGLEVDHIHNDMDLHRDTTAMNQNIFATDSSRSNHFIRTERTYVTYLTYEKELGKFSYLVGLRGEYTTNSSDLVTKNMVINDQYTRLYPSLHTSYKIAPNHELQLNYSHRIRRPEDEELNPFPEYQDPINIRVGNPYLKPEDILLNWGINIKKRQ